MLLTSLTYSTMHEQEGTIQLFCGKMSIFDNESSWIVPLMHHLVSWRALVWDRIHKLMSMVKQVEHMLTDLVVLAIMTNSMSLCVTPVDLCNKHSEFRC